MRISWMLPGLIACGSDPPSDVPTDGTLPPTVDTDVVDTDTGPVADTDATPIDTDVPVPGKLFGTVPPIALPAPDFTQVVNYDLGLRSNADLLGHPTVLWFYPAAGTGG